MKIAVPTRDGRVDDHFGHCAYYTIFDIIVISYNDAPINEVILNGLTSVSTDFKQMGATAAQMILNKTPFKTKCDFRLIRRGTF